MKCPTSRAALQLVLRKRCNNPSPRHIRMPSVQIISAQVRSPQTTPHLPPSTGRTLSVRHRALLGTFIKCEDMETQRVEELGTIVSLLVRYRSSPTEMASLFCVKYDFGPTADAERYVGRQPKQVHSSTRYSICYFQFFSVPLLASGPAYSTIYRPTAQFYRKHRHLRARRTIPGTKQ